MKIDSLSEKLILYFILLGIGAIMIISAVAFYSTRKALMSRTFDQLISLRIVKMNQIDQFYADRARDITFLAGAPTPNPDPSHGMEGKFAGRFRSLGQYFKAFYILGSAGVFEQGCFDSNCSRPPAIPDQYFSKIRDKLDNMPVVVGDEFIDSQTGLPFQLIATRIVNPDTGKKKNRQHPCTCHFHRRDQCNHAEQ